jgi:energy-coupling factor transporter ATP-binding protein EcfA2
LNIERVTIEGGFLDGLDIALSRGLNVIIGGRGTGKTSLIELIRFCLNARSYTESSGERSREHAMAVLEDGQVTLTIRIGDNQLIVSRSASSLAGSAEKFVPPIVFSQTDVESLGLQATGRLALIDSFRARRVPSEPDEQKLLATIRSLSSEMQQLTKDIEAIEAQLVEKQAIETQLKDLAQREKQVAAESVSAKKKQTELQETTRRLSILSVSSEVLSRAGETVRNFASKVDALLTVIPTIERWPKEAGETDRLVGVRKQLDDAIHSLKVVARQLGSVVDQTDDLWKSVSAERTPLEKQGRELRKKIEELQQGAGAISRNANLAREKLAQLEALSSLKQDKYERLNEVQKRRGVQLDRLDAIWEVRFKDRVATAKLLNVQLNPKIQVAPIRAAQLSLYGSAISGALRGSGLRGYNELSMAIASRMSPRELVEIIETGDAAGLAALLDIAQDRALKLITHLRAEGTAEILTAKVEDDIKLELLDGTEYKGIESLSTGQRCTVVLPIILEHKDRVLIMDQPEDHLDNAFIVDTLLKAILNRGSDGQLLLSTHNANIPVLGNASRLFVMGSDGRRGFVERSGDLEDPSIVRAITSLMEGGAEAFERRARFYKKFFKFDE